MRPAGRNPWLFVPVVVCSGALTFRLREAPGNAEITVLLLALLSCLSAWWLSARPTLRNARDHGHTPVHEYYGRLCIDIAQEQNALVMVCQQAGDAFLHMSAQLAQAVDLARSTRLLSANAALVAADRGETGRGFVTVARDLSAISDTAEDDLQTLYLLAVRIQARLSHAPSQWRQSPADWLVLRDRGAGLGELRDVLIVAEDTVSGMLQRYQDDARMDVRWLQLGDAIRRLLVEMSDHLSRLRLAAARLESLARIVALAPPGINAQLPDIKKYFDRSPGGDPQFL